MTDELWHGVRDRVLRLRNQAGSDGVFASGAHGYALEPSLTEEELEDAEHAFGIRLPEEYRGFLRHVGAGGAGPAYGVFPLQQGDAGWDWAADSTHRTDTARLREPFTPQHLGDDPIDPVSLRMPAQYAFEYRDEFEAAYRRWEEKLWHPGRTAGAICLCDEGCLRRYWLVVSGDERGMIWRDYRADCLDLSPLFDTDGKRVTFGRWYLRWLSEAEQRGQR